MTFASFCLATGSSSGVQAQSIDSISCTPGNHGVAKQIKTLHCIYVLYDLNHNCHMTSKIATACT